MTDHQNADATEQLVSARGKVHGDFTDVSFAAQTLKQTARQSKNWSTLTRTQQEGLDMILHKVARILCGDPNHHDHWDDIAGYATITSNRIPKLGDEVAVTKAPTGDERLMIVDKIFSAINMVVGLNSGTAPDVRQAIRKVLEDHGKL